MNIIPQRLTMNWYKKAEDTESKSWMETIESLPEDDPHRKALQDFGKRVEVLKALAQSIALELINRYEGTEGALPAFIKVFELATLRVPGFGKETPRRIQNIITTVVAKLRRKYRDGKCKHLFPFIAEAIKSRTNTVKTTEE